MQLKGHSHSRLDFASGPNGNFVIKRIQDTGKMVSQAKKQMYFKNIISSDPRMALGFDVPEVVGCCDHCITMRYYNGLSIIDFIEQSSKKQLDNIVHNLFEFIKWEIQKSPIAKIDEVQIYSKFGSAIPPIDGYIPIGICHGDLTLSNMLFCDKKIILLDFIDCFIETPIQDIAKLLQEVNLMWSLHFFSGHVDTTKVKIGYNYLKKEIVRMLPMFGVELEYINYFYFTSLVRILPYVKTKEIYDLIIGEINDNSDFADSWRVNTLSWCKAKVPNDAPLWKFNAN